MHYTTTYDSPVGKLTLASDGESLIGLWREGQKHFGASVPGEAIERDDLPVFAQVKEWLDRYFGGEQPDADELPLAPAGSAFRQSVWDVMRAIPYGEVTTYGDIARRIGSRSARAVGGAVGHNPISIIVPCHRVVGASGKLVGYAGGVGMKEQLLDLERSGAT